MGGVSRPSRQGGLADLIQRHHGVEHRGTVVGELDALAGVDREANLGGAEDGADQQLHHLRGDRFFRRS